MPSGLESGPLTATTAMPIVKPAEPTQAVTEQKRGHPTKDRSKRAKKSLAFGFYLVFALE